MEDNDPNFEPIGGLNDMDMITNWDVTLVDMQRHKNVGKTHVCCSATLVNQYAADHH